MLIFLNSSRIPCQASVSMTLLAKIILNIICDSRSLFQNLIKNGNLNEKLTPENHQFGIDEQKDLGTMNIKIIQCLILNQ